MTKQAVEDLGRGLFILDADTPSTSSDAALKRQCSQAAEKARKIQVTMLHPVSDAAQVYARSHTPEQAVEKPVGVRQPPPKQTILEQGVPAQALEKPSSAKEGTDIRLSLGARLRQAREAKGLSAEDVAQVLKFKACDVEALESGNIEGYAPVYAVGYVRTYADFLGEKALGANVAEAVGQFRQEHFDPGKEVYRFPEQQRRRRVIGGSLIIGIIVMALGLYMVWQFTQGAQIIRGDADRAGPDAYQASIMNGVVTR